MPDVANLTNVVLYVELDFRYAGVGSCHSWEWNPGTLQWWCNLCHYMMAHPQRCFRQFVNTVPHYWTYAQPHFTLFFCTVHFNIILARPVNVSEFSLRRRASPNILHTFLDFVIPTTCLTHIHDLITLTILGSLCDIPPSTYTDTQWWTYLEHRSISLFSSQRVRRATHFRIDMHSDRPSKTLKYEGQDIFLFSTASRPAVGPTQPPVQWVPWALSRE
jgi:hypothetical protein